MKTNIAVPNGILFILDPANTAAVVPEYVPGESAAATPSCVSIATIADVDGEAIVCLDAQLEESIFSTPVQVFDGLVETPGRTLAVVNSNFDRVLEVATATTMTRIIVRVDDMHHSAKISVEVNYPPDPIGGNG